ncbi:MAG: polyprenol phosphomannose-dependent alpha 1,6 mannosyltransferase MptB [Solirubrobacteraceae bacterium]
MEPILDPTKIGGPAPAASSATGGTGEIPRIVVRPDGRALAAQIGLAGMLALTLLVGLAAPATRFLVPTGAPGTTVPDWILGPLAAIDVPLTRTAFCLALVAMVACWALSVRGADTLPPRAALVAIVGAHLVLLLAPPLLSTDVFTYLGWGRLDVIHGVNPYDFGPGVRPQDPVFPWTGLLWTDTPTMYGPVFSALASAAGWLGPAGGLWTLKLLTASASLACVWLTWSCARALGRDPVRASVMVGLNPILLVFALGGAHNDLLMLALMLAGIRLVLARRDALGGAAVAAAVAVKATGGLLLPFLVIGARGGRRRAVAGAVAALVAFGALGFALYGTGPLGVAGTILGATEDHIGELRSVPGILSAYSGLGPIGGAARIGLGALFLLALVGSLAWAVRRPDRWIAAAAAATLALLLTATQLHPWYVVWTLPLAALSGDRRIRAAAIALTAIVVTIHVVRWLAPLGINYPHGG